MLIQKKSFHIIQTIPELAYVYQLIKPISQFYPNFNSWYFDKVITGVTLGEDKVIALKEHNNIIGVSIIKDNDVEKKLRCVRIIDSHQNKGLGLSLIDESLKQLKCEKPMCSVAQELFHDYSRIFVEKYHFDLSHVYKGLYREQKLEYTFNEKIPLKKQSIYF